MTLLARWGYTLLLLIVLPFLFITSIVQRCRSDHPLGVRWLSRFGLGFKKVEGKCVLVHCVSVGEVTAAAPLIRRLLSDDPSVTLVVTTTTATGAEQVKNLFANRVRHYYLPVDVPFAMAHMLDQLQPKKVLIVEVELWPNFLCQCAARDIPVIVVNARMTARSAKTYARIGALFFPMLGHLSHVAAQGKRDAEHYLQLGLKPEKLTLTHNLKFDLPTAEHIDNEKLEKQINPYRRPLFLAGSTHDPEESTLLDALRILRKTHPDVLLVLVPRHPQRFDTVYDFCVSQGWETQRSTEGESHGNVDIVLVDEMGKLSALYQLAELAYVGGSLAPRGGHNALEAARFRVPVIMGPSQHNNPEICQQLAESGALVTIHSAEEICAQARVWLDDAAQREASGQAAQQVITRNSGAIEATMAIIARY